MTAPPLPGPAPRIAVDRFPTTVTHPDGGHTWDRARVLLTVPEKDTAGRLLVFTAPGNPVVDLAWDPASSQIKHPRVTWSIATERGLYLIDSRRGCRCGGLAGWLPFEPMRGGSLPKEARG